MRIAFLLAVIQLALQPCPAGGLRHDPVEVGDEVELVGVVSIYGSEPRTYVGLLVSWKENPGFAPSESMTAGHGDPPESGAPERWEVLFRVAGTLVDQLSAHQGEWVHIIGTITADAIGPGFPAVIEVDQWALE
jgi:hypothetical protein